MVCAYCHQIFVTGDLYVLAHKVGIPDDPDALSEFDQVPIHVGCCNPQVGRYR